MKTTQECSTQISEALWLVKSGIPFDAVFAMDDGTRKALAAAFAKSQEGADG